MEDHLQQLDSLRSGIGLRAYGQRDPLNEFKQEAFALFSDMLERIREQTVFLLSHVELRQEEPPPPPPQVFGAAARGGSTQTGGTITHATGEAMDPERPETWGKVPRNAPCPCGSGMKYKRCHGRVV